MLHKDYDWKCSVEKKWSWVSRGLSPRLNDWRKPTSRKVTLTALSLHGNSAEWHKDKPTNTALLILIILWHIFWKPGLWSQQRQPLLGNSTVTTRDLVFSMRSTPRSHSNMYARNNRGIVGNGVLCGSVQRLYLENRKMVATCSLETSVDFQRTIWRYMPEDRTLHLRGTFEINRPQ
jgi:hypothetical protein